MLQFAHDPFTPPMRAEERWKDEALCAETDPELFFPEKGGSTKAPKALCRVCPVAAQCLQYALETDQRFGIWGGMSERDRNRLRQKDSGAAVRGAAGGNARWERRRRIAELHAEGLMDTEIAARLGISAEKVGRHRRSLGLPTNSRGGYRL